MQTVPNHDTNKLMTKTKSHKKTSTVEIYATHTPFLLSSLLSVKSSLVSLSVLCSLAWDSSLRVSSSSPFRMRLRKEEVRDRPVLPAVRLEVLVLSELVRAFR